MDQKKFKLEQVSIRLNREQPFYSSEAISSTKSAIKVLEDFMSDLDKEIFCVVNMTAGNQPININVVSKGTSNATMVSPDELFKTTILSNAKRVLLAHNHPSGNTKPSLADLQTTKRIITAGQILGIEVLDHVIIGYDYENKCSTSISMREHEFLSFEIPKSHTERLLNKVIDEMEFEF